MRSVRLQKADYHMHHNDYHGNYFGPILPATEEEQFSTVIMAVAGYVPEFGISFRKHRPKLLKLSEQQRHQLQFSGDIRIGSVDAVRSFMRHYVMSQPIESVNIKDLTIEEFITTRDETRRRLLGHTILAQITDKATETVQETYWQANRRQLLLPGLPNNVQRFAKTSLGTRRNRNVLVNQLHAKLAS